MIDLSLTNHYNKTMLTTLVLIYILISLLLYLTLVDNSYVQLNIHTLLIPMYVVIGLLVLLGIVKEKE